MRARCPQARLAMLSTAWSRTDPFWNAWASDDPTWIRLQATADEVAVFAPEFLESERRALGDHAFNREYLGIPGGAQASPFTWDLFECAIYGHRPSVPAGSAFAPSTIIDPANPATWFPCRRAHLIAHDVGRCRDRSTAVVDARSEHNAVIIADLSYDPTYAEMLLERFGGRVIGLQICKSGDGSTVERRQVGRSAMWVYNVGRSYLLELLHARLQARLIRMVNDPMSRRAYQQLTELETEMHESGTIYKCPSGRHDDLGMSCAMLAWAARHPHLTSWGNFGAPVSYATGPMKLVVV